jgi:hypothetical protein
MLANRGFTGWLLVVRTPLSTDSAYVKIEARYLRYGSENCEFHADSPASNVSRWPGNAQSIISQWNDKQPALLSVTK